MTESANVATTKGIYEAFGRGDIAAILDVLADDVEWEAWADDSQRAEVPWLHPREGRAGAAEYFDIVGRFQIHDFQVLSLLDGGDQVAVEVVIEADTPNGGHLRDEELHLWSFDEAGKVKRMRHYVDTAKHQAAAGGAAAAA